MYVDVYGNILIIQMDTIINSVLYYVAYGRLLELTSGDAAHIFG